MRQVTTLVFSLLLFGCFFSEQEIEPSQFDRNFFRLTTGEQVKQFHGYDFETQYELLIIGNQVVHPPALYLTGEFAKQGQTVVTFLREKLTASNKEVTVRDVVAVLSDMQRLKSYDVKNDTSLMAFIEERTTAMKGQWKPVTQRMIEEIRNPPPR